MKKPNESTYVLSASTEVKKSDEMENGTEGN